MIAPSQDVVSCVTQEMGVQTVVDARHVIGIIATYYRHPTYITPSLYTELYDIV